MLFPYIYVPHKMEKMQEFIDSIFEVWCKATFGQEFSLELFEDEAEIKDILSHFGFAVNAPDRGRKFYQDIKSIYRLFSGLNSSQIDQLKQWYDANNDIEKVCANDSEIQIGRYDDITRINPDLSKELASFFKHLYSKELLNLAALRDKIGRIDEHYKDFMAVNTIRKCPFCGLSDLLGVNHTKREAYDHYLPKLFYPFNAINFKNLVPTCHHCNSSYKSIQDPSYSPKDPAGDISRRKAFYPYTTNRFSLEISINIEKVDIDDFNNSIIHISFGPAALQEEIETWRDVYGIDERYREKILDCDGKPWLVEVLDEWRWKDESAGKEGKLPHEYLRDLNRHARSYPYTGSNFLKLAFLEGCERLGLFQEQLTQ